MNEVETCEAELFGATHYEQATYCENEKVEGSDYCAEHIEPTEDDYEPYEGDPVAADAEVLAGAGWGMDEDYGYFGDEG